MPLAQSGVPGKGFEGNRVRKVGGYEIHAFRDLWEQGGIKIPAACPGQMFIIKELPDDQQVAPQQKLAAFDLCLKLGKYFF